MAESVIRRVVLRRWRDGVSPEQKLAVKGGLAHIGYASPVDAVDFGEDLGLVPGRSAVVEHRVRWG